MMENIPRVEFEIPSGQEIGTGLHPSVPADLRVTGWHCTGCGQRMDFEGVTYFADVVEGAMAHEDACPECPKPC